MLERSTLLLILVVLLIAGSSAVAATVSGTNWFEVGQFVVLIATLLALIYQLWRERQEHGFEMYQRLMRWYTDHVWQGAQSADLDDVWDPLPEERRIELDRAQADTDWGAWAVMTHDERRGYRWTREILEMFEQAHLVNRKGWMNDEQWQKWCALIEWWADTRYFRYAFEDLEGRLLPAIEREISELLDEQRDGDTSRRA